MSRDGDIEKEFRGRHRLMGVNYENIYIYLYLAFSLRDGLVRIGSKKT